MQNIVIFIPLLTKISLAEEKSCTVYDPDARTSIRSNGTILNSDNSLRLFGETEGNCIVNDGPDLFYRNCSDIPRWKANQWKIVPFPIRLNPNNLPLDFFMIQRMGSNRCIATELKAVMDPNNLRTPRKVSMRNCDDANIDIYNEYKVGF